MKIFSEELVEQAARELHVADLSRATIGEVLLVAQYLEQKTGIPFRLYPKVISSVPSSSVTEVRTSSASPHSFPSVFSASCRAVSIHWVTPAKPSASPARKYGCAAW